MYSTDEKGAIAELAVAHAASTLQIGVFKALTDGERYDLIFDLRPTLIRLPRKWATLQGDVVVIRCYSCRRTATGLVSRAYSAAEIDAIAGYCLELDACYLIPVDRLGGHRVVQLRIGPPKNNQRRGIRWAPDYEFATTLRGLGAVAQLGERLAGSQKATGSSPVGSTPVT